MKNCRISIALFFCIAGSVLHAQDTVRKIPFFVPQSTSFYASSSIRLSFKPGKNFSVDNMNLGLILKYSDKVQVNIINRTNAPDELNQYEFTDINLQFSNNFQTKKTLLKYGSSINVKLGKALWFPMFTNELLVFENAERYINPAQIIGGTYISKTLLTEDSAICFNLAAHTGDIVNHTIDAEVYDYNLSYSKTFKWNLGFTAQAGKAFGSNHLVNYAYIKYEPKSEKLEFDIRAGKLQALDETPYGIHCGIKRVFTHLTIGGYFEKRINQKQHDVIAGLSWGFTGDSFWSKLFSNFNIIYDFSSSTLWMWLPIIKINIQNK